MQHRVTAWSCLDISVVCPTEYGCCIDITLVSVTTGHIFPTFIVMSGCFLLVTEQYQRKINLLAYLIQGNP